MALYGYQEKIKQLIQSGKSIILQAPTGAGKTRAALVPFIDYFWDAPAGVFPKKCFYITPMRILVNQFTETYREMAASYKRTHKRELIVKRQTGEYKEDSCFQADLIFTTIDQVLSSWLLHPYSLPKRLGNVNAGALVGSYLIFDEFHLFDPDSSLPTTLQMLKTLKGISPFILMTATFSKEMLEQLAHILDAEPVLLTSDDLAEIPAQKKERYFQVVEQPLVTDEQIYLDHILTAHETQLGHKRSIVVCNQVERAQKLFIALKQQTPAGAEICLLHSRFLQANRQTLEEKIQREFHKNHQQHTVPSLILVATQVVEVGLDISCQALHTELAPAAAVLQRAGRCARYQGEVGQVYVYKAPNNNQPYDGTETKKQCQLTWEWLTENQNRPLAFTDEQALINHAQTPTDSRILKGLVGGASSYEQFIHKIWRGEGERGEVNRWVRDMQAISVTVHSDPEQLREKPFTVDSFSLHPSSLRGKFAKWQKANDQLDADFDEGKLPWLVQKLEEVEEDDKEAPHRTVINYTFEKVTHSHELNAPLLVLHPQLVGYSPELGLTLFPSVEWQVTPPAPPAGSRFTGHRYQKERYFRHIELVYQAYQNNRVLGSAWLQEMSGRLEKQFGWAEGVVQEMAQVVVWAHDIGKLSEGWQKWAHEWQKAVGQVTPAGEMLAHTFSDSANPEHKELDKKVQKKWPRPHHALESAWSALPYLLAVLPQSPEVELYRPLWQAGFTAIARHHAPFAHELQDSFQLVKEAQQTIQESLPLLPVVLQQKLKTVQLPTKLKKDPHFENQILPELFITQSSREAVACYLVLVRVLRFADQEGTKMGS